MSARIKGTALSFKIDNEEYWADITSAILENEEADGDVTTFADAAAGGARQFYFTVSAVQSTDTTSFWSMLWDNTGDVVDYVFAPHGNTTATTAQPHFTGTVKIPPKPSIGGDAGATYTFEVRMDCQEEPTKVTA